MITIFLLAISLSLDSLATSISLVVKNKYTFRTAIGISMVFGFFQCSMSLLGYLIGSGLEFFISRIDHWIAFILLSGVGSKFIFDSFEKQDSKKLNFLDWKIVCLLGVATSVDALVVGISLAFMQLHIVTTVLVIGIVTFLMAMAGFFSGKKLAIQNSAKIEVAGGVVLILIGFKILISHLYF
jgi:putative Mn2+ efflux pump MntP